ncbi:beta-lactamase family protein [Amycolatopsis sp. CA-126428]|uniref:beta-lactamase family protein n=1 Tax=Amycolatopsis sp. CA-126428 TaxID=2073158 RepID=UPI001E448CDF|nr:beta-lactamase family protein [Amycolatopsis sp. CA-126428]
MVSSTRGPHTWWSPLLAQDGALDLDQQVAHDWPESGAADKSGSTLQELLAHRAAVVGADGGFTGDEPADNRAIAKRLARSGHLTNLRRPTSPAVRAAATTASSPSGRGCAGDHPPGPRGRRAPDGPVVHTGHSGPKPSRSSRSASGATRTCRRSGRGAPKRRYARPQ